MSTPNNTPVRSTIDLIRGLQDGTMTPSSLNKEEKMDCTEFLISEGKKPVEIAQFLRCAPRTISRYRAEIAERNALTHDPKLAGIIAGQHRQKADLTDQVLLSIIRGKNTSDSDKIEACRVLLEGHTKLTRSLQSMGYLPTSAQRIDAAISMAVPSLEELQTTVQSLSVIEAQSKALGLPELSPLHASSEEETIP